MKFKVGDIITGRKDSHLYSYTTSEAIMEVVGVSKYDIDVKIITHETLKDCVGTVYSVNPKHFILVSSVNNSNYIEIREE